MRATDGRKHMWVCSSAHPDTALSRAGRNNMTGATRSTSALGKPAGMRLGRAQGGITLETAKRLVYFHSDPSRAHVLKFMKRNCCEDLSGDLCCLFRCFFFGMFFFPTLPSMCSTPWNSSWFREKQGRYVQVYCASGWGFLGHLPPHGHF